MNTVEGLKQLRQRHLNLEYSYIESLLVPKLKLAVINLALKLPTKEIQLSCGGNGTNLSLWIHNKEGRAVAEAAEDLRKLNHYYRGYNKLFGELMALQVEFNTVMELGFYPDLGDISYNPVTKTVEHGGTCEPLSSYKV